MSETTAPTVAPRPIAPTQVTAWTGFLALMRWSLASTGAMLPLIIIVQTMLAVGLIIGFGFVIGDVTADVALHLSTGAPTVLLLTVGLVIVPQGVSRARASGAFDYQRALPVARLVLLLVDLVVWALIALPGVAVGLLVAWLHFDLTYSFDWPLLIAAPLLITTMSTAVGYAIAVSMSPMPAQMVSQVLVFFVLLFSPITFPAEQLPQWFQALHDYLPIRPAADLLRAGIAGDVFTAHGRDLLVLIAWTGLGLLVTGRALVRRR